MRKKNKFTILGVFLSLMMLTSCTSDDNDGSNEFPLSADIFYSLEGKRVAFQGLTHSASDWVWDFGDGTTSTAQNPVHTYADGGYYIATLTATDANGETVVKEVQLAVDLTPYILLTGGPTDVDGKTWKLTAAHPAEDKLANADADFSPIEQPLPQGAFDLILGMGEIYQDEFTFHFDGRYEIDVKDDNAAFSGLIYQFATTGGAGIVNPSGQDFGLCTGLFEPQEGMTFTHVESETFVLPSVYGPGGILEFPGTSTLDFSAGAYIGFLDFQSKVVVQEIKDNSMRLVMFMAASQDFIGVNTHALELTFEVVK